MSKNNPNLNRARNMDVDNWRRQQVTRRTKDYFVERDGAVPPVASAAYQREYARQEELFNAERRALRAEKHRSKEDAPKHGKPQHRKGVNRAERQAFYASCAAWWAEHQHDTDEQLLAYVKRESTGFAHLPKTTDIVGADHIANRFGGWRMTLFLAGVTMPESAALPSQAELDEARRRMDARRAEREKSAASEEAAETDEY